MQKNEARQDAINLGSIYYTTGKLCKQGHMSERRTKTGRCLVCERVYQTSNPQREYHQDLKRSEKYKNVAKQRLDRLYGTDEYRAQTRATHLKRKYNLTPDEHTKMYQSQGGKCDICSKHMEQINNKQGNNSCVVDHDHSTGRIRSLLCGQCNRLLGQANDDTDILQSAIQYLQRHNTSNG